MRVLLDRNLPRAMAALLPGHRIETTHQRRWSDLDDGPLPAAAEGEFDAFITMDQNLRYQQNLKGRQLRIIVILASSKRLSCLAPAATRILAALAEVPSRAS
jgi:predicted nuclease of predicted toxin-antitoxin system